MNTALEMNTGTVPYIVMVFFRTMFRMDVCPVGLCPA